ncbi:uncharacterized protein LOC117786221 [Drosophila innubila]|uniref:uncharacterized protein LOC117786221 n=1 Tax=Drosophila innubila TaxID=198719 RepID=UPI00148E4812|nr:uncharacterized protein LOC117786221 [Drosophila innubila]
MLRAVFSVSQRVKLPHAVILMKTMDHTILAGSKLRLSQSLFPSRSRQLVRCFASGDDRIKGAAGANQGGIIGTVGSQATMGQAAGTSDAATCAQVQVQAATFGTRDDKVGKQCDNQTKAGNITSQLHATPSLTECGKIGTAESAEATKPKKETGSGSGQAGSVSNLADDAVKQLQEAAANLPSKAQVEKFVFRVVAFVYDILYLTGTWTIRFVNEKILQNATVKHYWKQFHDKMEQAKKD